MQITLKNDFHNTTITARPQRVNGVFCLNKKQYQRARRVLCPSHASGCSCGVVRGGRVSLQDVGDRFEVYLEGERCA